MADVGQIGVSSAVAVIGDISLDISLLGVEPGRPGEPEVVSGNGLTRNSSNEVIIDRNVVVQSGLGVGDILTVKSVQGTDEEFYDLTIVGLTDGQKYSLQPSVFVPYLTWEKVRPQAGEIGRGELVSNIVAVRLVDPTLQTVVADRIRRDVARVEVVDRVTAYESTPGYSAQQSTLNTPTLLYTLYRHPCNRWIFSDPDVAESGTDRYVEGCGHLKSDDCACCCVQIMAVNAFGVALGAVGSLLLSLSFPPAVPIVFTANAVTIGVLSLLLIGPLGGLCSVFALLKVEPLTALGLAQ